MDIVLIKNPDDPRIALVPTDIKKLTSLGHKCFLLSSTGIGANLKDSDFSDAGATVLKNENDLKNILKTANIVVSTKIISNENLLRAASKEALFVTMVNQYLNGKIVEKYKELSLKLFAMEFLPRITRLQNMDILSSQSNIGGYRAVIEALHEYGRVCPMMTTAAGTIKPSRFLIIGAGVAGLQAIATAKRMGAVVSVFDVRTAAKEQVESLGATFIEVESKENLETSGGYAKETSEEYKNAQAAKLSEEIKKVDVVITTANIPGRAAPKLVTEEMIKSMKNGSIIVDMAAEMGGNTDLTEVGKNVKKHGTLIIGEKNLTAKVPESSSNLFSRNILNLLQHIIKDNVINKSDEALEKCFL